MNWVSTEIKLDEMAVGESRCVSMGDLKIGLFRRKESVVALDNLCPHRNAPLHEGHIHEEAVVCPWHQWSFRLADGVCTNIPGSRVKTYNLKLIDGVIWLEV